MVNKKYNRKNARGILTPKELDFLNNLPNRNFDSKERHMLSSIRNKTKKALEDVELIFKKCPYSEELLLKETFPPFKKTIEEITKRIYHRNYLKELWRMRKKYQTSRKPDKRVVRKKTKNQINKIVNSTLKKLKL